MCAPRLPAEPAPRIVAAAVNCSERIMASTKTASPVQSIRRRQLIGAAAGVLATPGIASAQGRKVLTFIPQSDLAILDPIFTAAYVTRHHGMMVFDTLYGMDEAFQFSRKWPRVTASRTTAKPG